MAGIAVAVYASVLATDILGYDRARIFRGQPWRIATGNWVHFSLSHLLWNLAVLIPVGGWCEAVAPRRVRWFYLLAPVATGLVLLGFDGRLERYGGLSGIATGLVVLLALIKCRRREDRPIWVAVLALVAVKIGIEWCRDRAIFARFADGTIHPVPLAHLTGSITAVVIGLTGRNEGAPR